MAIALIGNQDFQLALLNRIGSRLQSCVTAIARQQCQQARGRPSTPSYLGNICRTSPLFREGAQDVYPSLVARGCPARESRASCAYHNQPDPICELFSGGRSVITMLSRVTSTLLFNPLLPPHRSIKGAAFALAQLA